MEIFVSLPVADSVYIKATYENTLNYLCGDLKVVSMLLSPPKDFQSFHVLYVSGTAEQGTYIRPKTVAIKKNFDTLREEYSCTITTYKVGLNGPICKTFA